MRRHVLRDHVSDVFGRNRPDHIPQIADCGLRGVFLVPPSPRKARIQLARSSLTSHVFSLSVLLLLCCLAKTPSAPIPSSSLASSPSSPTLTTLSLSLITSSSAPIISPRACHARSSLSAGPGAPLCAPLPGLAVPPIPPGEGMPNPNSLVSHSSTPLSPSPNTSMSTSSYSCSQKSIIPSGL